MSRLLMPEKLDFEYMTAQAGYPPLTEEQYWW
jgi:hypothetical protein